MSRAIMGRKEAAFTTAFLRDEGVGYGQMPPQTEYFDVEGSDAPGERTTYVITVPHGWLRQFLFGVGGSEESVVMTIMPEGWTELLASNKALKHIAREVGKGMRAAKASAALA